ncbi:hypothetical protein GPECTOR_37g207 [Gonium pectorale]|uniref:Protein kinase domain-containing protein n=1 Tax=Gonium pectorale TaxID=33097 RepID=A0A150GBH7_GONPE|nr:hypothetical protein GPECTOR_37g207 [Gonium pectorale]|eukprot:KXZ47201.1 hypothetical protein GPECTOR_37g207 [Gonium pectorale]
MCRIDQLVKLLLATLTFLANTERFVKANSLPASTVVCRNGPELAAALANPSVDEALLPNDLVLKASDWAGVPVPAIVSRNLTLLGDADKAVALDLGFVRGQVRLVNGVTLTLRNIAVANYRAGSFIQAPSFDLLLPAAPGEQATILFDGGGIIFRMCFPLSIALQAAALLKVRAPGIPGSNTWVLPDPPPPSCDGSGAAGVPTLERCFAYAARYTDVAIAGLDVAPNGSPVANGYLIHFVNVLAPCVEQYSDECLALGPLACVLYTNSLTSTPAPPHPPLLPPGPSAGPAAAGGTAGPGPPGQAGASLMPPVGFGGSVPGPSPAGDSARKRRQLAIALGCALGGSLLLAAAAGALLAWRGARGRSGRGGLKAPPGSWASFGSNVRARPASHDGPMAVFVSLGDESAGHGDRNAYAPQPDGGACAAATRSDLGPPTEAAAAWAGRKPGLERHPSQKLVSPLTPQRGNVQMGTRVAPVSAPRSWRALQVGAETEAAGGATPDRADVGAGADGGDGAADKRRPGGGDDGAGPDGNGHGDAGGVDAAEAAAGGGGGPDREEGDGVVGSPEGAADDDGAASDQVSLLPTVLGKGACGRVYEGLFKGELVAVKVILSDDLESLFGMWEAQPLAPAPPGAQQAAPVPLPQPVPPASPRSPPERRAAAPAGEGPIPARAHGDPNGPLPDEQQQPLGSPFDARAAEAAQEGGGGMEADPCPAPNPQAAAMERAGARQLRLFAAEVAVLGRCDHPNVVRLLAACLTPPRLCLVMERCETSLERLVFGAGGAGGVALLPLPTLLHIAIQICQGLEYLHPTIVHRDLKPANVLINGADTDRPVAKLADFGLARISAITLATRHPDAGTVECYDINNYVVTHHADMYALGVLLWAMLTGQQPWKDHTVAAVAYKVASLGERLPLDHLPDRRCPPQLRRLIRQCWEADPLRRPAAAEAVKELFLVHRELLAAARQRGQDAARAGSGARAPVSGDEAPEARPRGGAAAAPATPVPAATSPRHGGGGPPVLLSAVSEISGSGAGGAGGGGFFASSGSAATGALPSATTHPSATDASFPPSGSLRATDARVEASPGSGRGQPRGPSPSLRPPPRGLAVMRKESATGDYDHEIREEASDSRLHGNGLLPFAGVLPFRLPYAAHGGGGDGGDGGGDGRGRGPGGRGGPSRSASSSCVSEGELARQLGSVMLELEA